MAAALHFSGFKTTHSVVSRDYFLSQSVLPQQLHFAGSIASNNMLRQTLWSSCSSRAFGVSCEAINVDVLEKNVTANVSSGSCGNQLTCVMKFGGSSVASAERMREVADLILSFPNERPAIVLSAMGKTTNKLLLVHYLSSYCL